MFHYARFLFQKEKVNVSVLNWFGKSQSNLMSCATESVEIVDMPVTPYLTSGCDGNVYFCPKDHSFASCPCYSDGGDEGRWIESGSSAFSVLQTTPSQTLCDLYSLRDPTATDSEHLVLFFCVSHPTPRWQWTWRHLTVDSCHVGLLVLFEMVLVLSCVFLLSFFQYLSLSSLAPHSPVRPILFPRTPFPPSPNDVQPRNQDSKLRTWLSPTVVGLNL
jgi:hypothetical protein